jgi:hypothetical protein
LNSWLNSLVHLGAEGYKAVIDHIMKEVEALMARRESGKGPALRGRRSNGLEGHVDPGLARRTSEVEAFVDEAPELAATNTLNIWILTHPCYPHVNWSV